jgi:outer membrane protein assembly factor BamA
MKNQSQFDYKKIFSSLLIGKRLNQFNKIYFSFSYHYIETKDLKIPFTISSDRIDHFPTIELGYEYDNRDLIQFPKSGSYFALSGSAKGLNLNNQINYQTLKTDIRFYSKLFDELFFKTRNFTRFTIGKKIPIYDYSIIGTEEKIRGNFFKKIEDRNLFLLSSEFFIPLLRELYLNLDFIPIIPERLLNYRIEIYAHTFFDYGLVFREQIKNKSELSGFGIGLSFLILPFNVIRFEIGYNKFSKPEFIIDLGKFF